MGPQNLLNLFHFYQVNEREHLEERGEGGGGLSCWVPLGGFTGALRN